MRACSLFTCAWQHGSITEATGAAEIVEEMVDGTAVPGGAAAIAPDGAASASPLGEAAAAESKSASQPGVAKTLLPAALQQRRPRQASPRRLTEQVQLRKRRQRPEKQGQTKRRRQASGNAEQSDNVQQQQHAMTQRAGDSLAASQAVPAELSCPRLSQQDPRPAALQCQQTAPFIASA